MTEAAHVHAQLVHGHDDHAPTPPPTGWHRFTHPGWLRALWFTPLFGFFWLGVTCLIRSAADWHPIWAAAPIVTVSLVVFPLGFLVGIGGFDYWLYYMSGRPTRPDTHADHGARSWKDYFRINPDHKVIGMQYLCTVLFFFLVLVGVAILYCVRSWRAGG